MSLKTTRDPQRTIFNTQKIVLRTHVETMRRGYVVNIWELSPGMRVKVVDEWEDPIDGAQNHSGRMDRYLGTIMTVRKVSGDYVQMEEDRRDPESFNDGWLWFAELLDCIIESDTVEPVKAPTEDEIKLLFGSDSL